MKFIIEPRYLFDASVAHTAKHLHDPSETHHHADHVAAINHNTTAVAAMPSTPAVHEIVFIDPRVANWQTLASGVKPGVQVVILEPSKDGLAQITAALNGKTNLTSISIVSYGQPGEMELGNMLVNDATIHANAAEIASWGSHLSTHADILLWGCNVGKGSAGQGFINDLHSLTGAQIVASNDATGSAALGGDWVLEASTGTIHTHTPFTASALADYQGILDTPLPTVTFGTAPSTILLGSSFTEHVSFANTASSGVGFGPFVDVFVPADPAQTVALSTATYLGQSLTVTEVTLSTSAAGHTGVLGALHPLAVDSSGHPLFVAAPAGYQAGDQLYVITLPFGSFTPGQPAADIALNFTMANTTELSSSHGNQPLNITAIGGFEFGHDALNNPSSDPSIRGTGASATNTDSADGAVAAGSQITLINITAATDLHEGETATGPDYPFNYIVSISPAPVTHTDAISSLDFSFNVPNTVEYTQGPITITGPGGATGTATFTPGSSAQGGTVHIHFSSLAADVGNTPTTIAIPVFVPLTDSTGTDILNPATGAARTISAPTIYSYTGNWNPVAGSLDHNLSPQTFSGDSSTNPTSTDFVAKSLAIQITDNASSAIPGQVVTYTVNFQVSDYFDLNNLAIQTALSDGLSLLAPGDSGYVAPTLSITRGGTTTSGLTFGDASSPQSFTFTTPPSSANNETVAQSGSNSLWNYSRDDTSATASPGSTTINFSVGALLANQFGPGAAASVLQGSGGTGATQGTITFKGKVLDWYTNTFSERSLRQGDTVGETVNTSGTSAAVVTVAGNVVTATGSAVSDGSAHGDAVPQGSLALTIVAVNGTSVTGTPTINPGDTVTYALTYTLATGDYGNLTLSAFIPLPVFDAADPNANGGSVSTYTADTVDTFPVSGDYRLVHAPSGGAVGSTSVDATANSVNFNLGTLNSPSNAGDTVAVYFTVTASNKPYADGLFLTNQGNSQYTNAASVTSGAASIINLQLVEPELVTKTGIVGIVGDDGATVKGTYSSDPTNNVNGVNWTTQTTTPSNAFSAADSTGSPFTGGNPLANDNLNARGADAGDTVRVVSTVLNQGHATAFDVTISGALPTGYTTSDISHFQVADANGNPISFTGTTGDYFSTGVKLSSSLAVNTAYYVVYDLTLHSAQQTGQTLTAASSIVNWASYAGGVTAGDGFVSGGTPIGENANAIADNAALVTGSPSISKTAVAGSDTASAGSAEPVNLNNVVLGETVQYSVTVTLPEGATSNDASPVNLQDVLPTGMTFVSLDSVTYGSGVSHTGGGTVAQSGQTLTFNLGTGISNSNADSAGTITILYTAKVTAANTPADGHTYVNSASLVYNGMATNTGSVTLTEKDPLIAETISVVDTATGTAPSGNIVYSNEDLTYTITLTNNGHAPANGVLDFVTLPAGLTYIGGSLTHSAGGVNATVDDSLASSTGLQVAADAIAAGQSAIFTFRATVNNSQPFNTALTVQTPNDGTSGVYNSLPAAVGTGHNYTDSALKTLHTGQLTGTLSIVAESNNTTASPNTPAQTNTQIAAAATVGEVVRMHAYVQVPEGSNATSLNFTLPSGLTYLNDGTATIAFISPDSSLTSSNGAFSGVTQFQDSNSAGAHYINPVTGTTTANDIATFSPVDALPGSTVNTSTANHVVIDLGTLTNNAGSTTANYVLIEFNAVVANVAGNMDGTTLSTTVKANGGTASNATVVTVKEPSITVAKTATAVNGTTGTVTYAVTLTNNGDATAYNVTLDNPAVSNEQNITFVSSSGPGTVTDTTTGTDLHDVVASLAAGQSETFTYTVKVTDPLTAVTNDVATATWSSLGGTSTFHGSTAGANDGTGGFRDFNAASNPPNDYAGQATADLGTASGRVWQDLGSDQTHFNTATDTPLQGITVSADLAGPDGIFGNGDDIIRTTTTAADGTYSFGMLPDGNVRIMLNANGSAGGPAANETLLYDPDQNSRPSNPAGAIIAIASGGAVTGADFAFQTPDTPPAISTWNDGTVRVYVEGSAPIVLSNTGAASVADTQLDTLITAGDAGVTDYRNTVLTVQRYASVGGAAAPNANDIFAGDGNGTTNLLLSGGNVRFGGMTLGSYIESGGVLTITFTAGTQKADIGNVLDHLTYLNSGTGLSGSIVTGATLYDGNEAGSHDYQGIEPHTPHSIDNTSAPVFTTINLQPPAASTNTFTEPNNSSASAVSVSIIPSVTLSSGSYTGAQVSITGNFHSGQDILTANTTGTTITASYNATTGVLTFSGTDTLARYQQALLSVRYYNSSDAPNVADRTVTLAATRTNGTDALGTETVHVVSDNDSPVLAAATKVATAIEDSSTPVGVVGTLVQNLVTGIITDPDGPSSGIAITHVMNSFAVGGQTITGNWYYSINNGTTWIAMPTLTAGQALDLKADGATRLYFQPTTGDYNGTLPAALTFRAWDNTYSVTNGMVVTLPNAPGTGLSSSGVGGADNSSYSTTQDTIALSVTALNDAPIATGTASLPTSVSGNPNPLGETVAHLFGPTFSDNADEQHSAGNIDGSTSHTLAGIAITGNAATTAQGVWQYSIDSGTHWISITTVSTTSSIVLPATAELRFLSNSSFQGTPGALSAHLIDSSSGAVTASTNVNVSVNGGITPISADAVPLTTLATVQPLVRLPFTGGIVRDDPILDFNPPIIPQNWLIGTEGSRFIITEQNAIIQVPPDIFQDTDPSQQLTYDAKLPGGAPLPSWLNFDAKNLIFSGMPPEYAFGSYEIMITARDNLGHSAVAEFRILVGRNEGDLVNLLSKPWRAVKVNATHPQRPHAQRPHAPHSHANMHVKHHHPKPQASITPPASKRFAFSDQLMHAGKRGSLASAYALLKAFSPINPQT